MRALPGHLRLVLRGLGGEDLPAGPPADRLVEYVKHFSTVEIDSTFYGTPRGTTVQRWRTIAPRGFLFAARFPRAVTHETNLVGSEGEAERFVHTMAELEDRLGPLLLQLPTYFDVEGMGVLEDFLKRLPEGFRYAVEVRHRSWFGSDLPAMLRERGVALTLVDYPKMPRLEESTTDFAYIRWLGNRREFPSGHTHLKKDRDDDLLWWAGVVDRFLEEVRLSSPTRTTTITAVFSEVEPEHQRYIALAQEVLSVRNMTVDAGGSITVQTAVRTTRPRQWNDFWS